MSLANTVLQSKISNYQQEGLDKYLRLESTYGAMQAFTDDTAMIPSGQGVIKGEDAENIAKSGYMTNGPKINVIQKDNITIGTSGTTTCFATTPAGTSVQVGVTYNTLDFDLIIPLNAADYNYVGWDDNLGVALQERMIAAREAINAACLAHLETNKNQQQGENLLDFFVDSGANEFDIPVANKDDMFNYMRALFTRLKLNKTKRHIGNEIDYASNVYKQYNQGTANSTNTNWQFGQFGFNEIQGSASDTLWYQDISIADGLNVRGTSYEVPVGSLALINAIDHAYYEDPMKKEAILKGGEGEVFSTELPGFPPGFKWGVKRKINCVDGRENESWQFECKFVTMNEYVENITTDQTSIQKFQVKTA